MSTHNDARKLLCALQDLFTAREGQWGQMGWDPATGERRWARTYDERADDPADRKALTYDEWRAHLNGAGGAGGPGLGLSPLLRDGTCRWGVIEWDARGQTDAQLADLARRVDALALPLTVCRSKSGGAHLYAFLSDATPAALVRRRLAEWTAALGLANPDGRPVELFPKEDELPRDRHAAWINLPYYAHKTTARYALDATGQRLKVAQFVARATRLRASGAVLELGRWAGADDAPRRPPPTTTRRQRYDEQGRNCFLFAWGKVYFEQDPDGDWRDRLRSLNRGNPYGPPLDARELEQIVRSIEKGEPGPLPLTDVGNAERWRRVHGPRFRWCDPLGGWLVWNGKRWEEDRRNEAHRTMQLAVRDIMLVEAPAAADAAMRDNTVKWWRTSETGGHIDAALKHARALPGVTALPEEFDRDPWVLNTQSGVVDLRTGELRAHDRGELITYITRASYDADAEAPRWTRFLADVTDGDDELAAYLQRAVGYALTGDTREQCFFLLYGVGANGKTTFVETLAWVLGTYALTTTTETFLAGAGRNAGAASPDLADLRSARLVLAGELPEGRALDEPLVKALTGGDVVAARRLYKDFFRFTPEFKLFLSGNHKPAIRGGDVGIWRRVRLVPFEVTFPPAAQDRELGRTLRDEAAGILAWAVRGALDWRARGLAEPERVRGATAAYRDEQDWFRRFVRERLEVQPPSVEREVAWRTPAATLYETYRAWADANGHARVLTADAFGNKLGERGFERGTAKIDRRVVRVWYRARVASLADDATRTEAEAVDPGDHF